MSWFHRQPAERAPEEPLEGKIVEGFYFDFSPEALHRWSELQREGRVGRRPTINQDGEIIGWDMPLANIVDLRTATPDGATQEQSL